MPQNVIKLPYFIYNILIIESVNNLSFLGLKIIEKSTILKCYKSKIIQLIQLTST